MFNHKRIRALEERINYMQHAIDTLDSKIDQSTRLTIPQTSQLGNWALTIPIYKLVQMILIYLNLEYKTCTTTEVLVKKEEK